MPISGLILCKKAKLFNKQLHVQEETAKEDTCPDTEDDHDEPTTISSGQAADMLEQFF